MGRIAFIFPGQGDQHPGMGKELADKYFAAEETFRLFERIRPGTRKQCFEGPEEELKETKNTQPCMFAVELAGVSALLSRGILPEAAAGFSLGEVAAAAVAGMFDPETGFKLVCRRGELMQQAAEGQETGMAAVLRLSAETVEDICSRYKNMYPVNYNCPGQITVSGAAEEMPALAAAVKEAGGRALPLKVKGAFHSPYMQHAAEAFRKELDQAAVQLPELRLYANKTAEQYPVPGGSVQDMRSEEKDPITICRDLLAEQICSPVRWEKLIRNMIADGIDTFVEIGPGRTLTNMIRKIDPAVTAKTVFEYLEEISSC